MCIHTMELTTVIDGTITTYAAIFINQKSSLDEGCSVYHHRDWRFYEFNVFRGQQVPERRPMGLYRATMRLYQKIENEEDLLS